MELKGSKTEQNMKTALAGESLARNKYTFYAMQAKKEGHPEIAELFEKMALNETTHAKIWFSALHGGLGNSVSNVEDAANGEHGEWSHMYPEFAETAREEGFEQLATLFDHVAKIEKDHEKMFLRALVPLIKKIEDEKKSGKTVSAKEQAAEKPAEVKKPEKKAPVQREFQKTRGYRCIFCGAVFPNRLDVCPVCEAIGSFEAVNMD